MQIDDIWRVFFYVIACPMNLFHESQTAQWCLRLIINMQGVNLLPGRCQSQTNWVPVELHCKQMSTRVHNHPPPIPIHLIQSEADLGLKFLQPAYVTLSCWLRWNSRFMVCLMRESIMYPRNWWKNTLICQCLTQTLGNNKEPKVRSETCPPLRASLLNHAAIRCSSTLTITLFLKPLYLVYEKDLFNCVTFHIHSPQVSLMDRDNLLWKENPAVGSEQQVLVAGSLWASDIITATSDKVAKCSWRLPIIQSNPIITACRTKCPFSRKLTL